MARLTDAQMQSLSDNEIRSLSPEQLDQIIDRYDTMIDRHQTLNEEQTRVYNTAVQYRRELDRTNESLEKSGGLLGKVQGGLGKISETLNGINGIVQNGFLGPIDALGKSWGKADDAANKFGQHVGGNAESVARLRDESIKFANDVHIGSKYNASISEMIQLQESYSKSVGRNLQLTNSQRETLLATSKIMGDKAVDFSKKLENLGIGMERSGDLAAKMFNEASKSGISFEKYSASVTENLTKVQSYGFRNGVEGLTAMAKKAAEVNLNISEAFKVADKIQSGGIQEAIKMGANLQVLGGSFAGMGDPMGMLYQGLNDVEGLQDRMIKMFSGLGQLENGQVKITGANRLRVNAAAQAMGISSDEMFNMINRQAVRGEIDKQMAGTAASRDEELAELIRNTATLDKNNNAVVNIGGKPKALKDITDKDKEYLKNLQKSESEDIKDIAQILRGYSDVQEGFTKEVENKKASAFSEIGKFTKMLYGKMGKSNELLTIIKDAVLAMTVANALGSVGRGFGRIGGRGGRAGGVGRGLAGGRAAGGAAGGGAAAGNAAAGGVANATTGGGGAVTRAAGGIGRTLARGAGRFLAGGVASAAFTGLGYIADGSFKGDQSQKTKAIAGTVGSAVLGGIGTAIGGPIGGMIGAELGKFAGEWVAKGIDKGRAKKKDELVKDLGGKDSEKGKALASLSDNYSKSDLKKIKAALSDGKITEGELSNRLMKKLAKSGDAGLIEKYGSTGAKAKINEQIEKINAKVEKGDFNMETGEFSIGNANFGTIEPVAMARGGKLEGPSDIGGPGMPIQGTNIVVGGGEYVVNAEATRKNEGVLNRINSGETIKMAEGGILPKIPAKISNILPSLLKNPMAPLPVRAAMSAADRLRQKAGGIDKMEVAPIKLDVSGTIKLDAGGQQVDLQSIVNNPAFLTQLSQMIERRLSDNVNGGNFKELRKNKRHTF